MMHNEPKAVRVIKKKGKYLLHKSFLEDFL